MNKNKKYDREISRPRKHWGMSILGAALLAALVGCGTKTEARLKAHPVQGKVTVAGKPEAGVRVTLYPKDPGNPKVRQAQGLTGPDGTFTLSTYVANDGAIEGDFAVTLQYLKLVDKGNGNVPGPNVLPEKYAKPQTTDITYHVNPGDNSIPPIDVK